MCVGERKGEKERGSVCGCVYEKEKVCLRDRGFACECVHAKWCCAFLCILLRTRSLREQ